MVDKTSGQPNRLCLTVVFFCGLILGTLIYQFSSTVGHEFLTIGIATITFHATQLKLGLLLRKK